jgi:pimeloyl-ACP methyl ester carboxylesterase
MTFDSIVIAGNRVAFDRLGKGSPVLLLHGAFQTRYLWRGTAEVLAARHTVIAPDLRGLGDSGAADGKFDFKSVATELASVPGVIETLFAGRERDYLDTVLRGGFTANKAGITDADLAAYAAAYAKAGVLAALGGYFRATWANAEDNKASCFIHSNASTRHEEAFSR